MHTDGYIRDFRF
uniref:Uncharacterized protein n=1 Tax=Rhizophora mucronata TaxID=61149 RepID=A0A2P2NXY3_RHIMU